MHKTIRATITAFIMLASLAGARADNTPQTSGVSAATLFTFRHVIVDTSTAAPAICLRFSQNLNTSPAAHYGDYLKFSPAFTPAISAAGTDLCLTGLDAGTTYNLTILHGLPAASGAKLATDQKFPVALTDSSPLVAISGDGFILSRNTANGLTIQTVNVTKVKIHVLRMSDKLIPQQMTGGNLTLGTNLMAPYDLNNLLQSTVSIAWTGTMTIPADHNRTVSTAFPIASVIPPGRDGLYLVVAENAGDALPESTFTGGQNTDLGSDTTIAAHWVIATDLALTSFSGSDGLHVFARSLTTGQPLANVEVRLISTGNDVLGQVLTDADGEADFPAPLMAGTRANAPTTLLAYGGGNFAFQNLTAPAFDLSDRGVSGRAAPKDFQAFMYTERGIYRPGETIHLISLLRDRTGNAVSNMPLKIQVRRPDGVVDHSFVAPPASDGGFALPIALSASAARGLWTIEAYVDPTAAPVGRVQADVEDFVPQQLKVTLTADQKYLNATDNLTGALAGAFLYGAPAAGLHAQGDLRVVRDNNPIPNAAGYAFGLVDDKVDDMDQSLTLPDADDKGNLQISAPLPQLPNTSVPLKAILTAGLFEPSGRYVSDVTEVPIRAQPLLIGIKPLFPDNQVGDGQPAKFDIATFGPAGAQAATQNLTWTLVEENQIFDWFEDNNSNWTWHYHTEDQQLASGAIDTTADKPAEFTAPGLGQYDWGTYRLIVTDNNSGAATSVRFNIGWDSTGASASTPDKEEIAAEKPLLTPGETTEIHIKGPFAGTAQIVIANDRVFSTQTMAIPKDGATFTVKADAAWGAGAYVIVTAIRPLNAAGPQQPVRAIGVAWLGIDPAAHRLGVAIAAPAKITPRQSVTIPVKITGATADDTPYVTLAAVDEGILQLTRFTTPDPLSFLYGKLNLAMDIRDDYGNLLDGSADAGAIQQGGDSASLGGPGLPVTSTKVVSLFSGPVTVDKNGVAQIPVSVPDFEGQLRLMVVAYNKTQAGAAQAAMIVRDPVIEDVAVPRFLAPGDTANLAISLHNTDGPPGAYKLVLTGTGAAKISADKTYTLAAGQRVQDAAVIAAHEVGIATINADLTGPGKYAVHRSWQIAVRAAHYPVTLQSIAMQAKNTDFKPDPKLLASFQPGGLAITIGYAAYQGIDVPSLLQSLWLYPYGCTEQLSSTAFPLLYYNQKALLAAALPGDASDWQDTSTAGVKARVQAAIDTILDRQDDTGTFGLWSVGDGEASAWLNVYAMDFLLHAKAAGYSVPDDALSRGDEHLLSLVQQIDSGAEGNSYTEAGLEAPQATLAYAEYVLAGTSQADIGLLRRMNDAAIYAVATDGAASTGSAPSAALQYAYWAAAASGSTLDGNSLAQPLALAQLGGALSLMGDKYRSQGAFQMAVANIGIQTYPVWWTDDAYYSETRDLAGMIAIAADTNNPDLANQLLVKLAGLNVNPEDLGTQEQAWLLAAAAALDKNAASISLAVNSKAMTLPLPAAFAPTPAEIAAGYTIKNASAQNLWRTFTLTGAPRIALPAISKGYSLQKAYFKLDGTPLDPAHLRQNDRFIVDLSGQVNDDADHRTVVVDLLPAGWEIDAPITDDSADYGFLGPLSKTRVIEARDDRFVAAFDLGSGWANSPDSTDDSEDHLDPDQFHVAYLVRVVTPGAFTLPEAEVNDMYKPALMARTASSHTIITPR
jgi:uncharacterized protein YfaS (alpha-2-macroglobulin family)